LVDELKRTETHNLEYAMSTIIQEPNNHTEEILRFAPLFQAFLECSDELQAHARKLVATLVSPHTDEDDRALAAMTLADVLFPNRFEGEIGSDLEECEAQGAQYSQEAKETLERMDREEATFAERLRNVMHERGVTQVQLAEKIGVGQSAIAMMLQRECRPQRRTVARMAEALEVTPDTLWPGFGR
jgi:lambda repressor-like predicted transcriptional regulator